jgi:tetratricopeptide (TPR) repeat protein
LKRGDLARAERLARQAAEYDPEAEDHAALIAWIRASSPRPNALGESIAALTNLLRRHPRCELALLYRSKLFRRGGKVDPALSDLEQLLAINPDHREAQAEARLLRAKQRSR